jgi:hypothetical protein
LDIPIQEAVKDRSFRWWQSLIAGLSLLLLVGLGWWLIDGWRLRQATPALAVAMLYRRLHRQGQRLAAVTDPGDTPNEFATRLAKRVTMLPPDGRWKTALAPAPQEINHLTDLYVQSRYSPHAPDRKTQNQAIRTWRRLRRRLWLARLYFIWTRSKLANPDP